MDISTPVFTVIGIAIIALIVGFIWSAFRSDSSEGSTMNIGSAIQIAFRLITNIGEIQRLVPRALSLSNDIQKMMPQLKSIMDEGQKVLGDAHALVGKIAPELLPQAGAQTAPDPIFDVRWLQQSLNTLMNAGLAVDGDYGPLTKAAVENFQRANGLTVDGWAGVLTEAAITEQLAKRK